MAKNSYVHPVIITDWLHSLGITPKQVNYKHKLVKDSKELSGVKLNEGKYEDIDKAEWYAINKIKKEEPHFKNVGFDEEGYLIGNCSICGEHGVLVYNHAHEDSEAKKLKESILSIIKHVKSNTGLINEAKKILHKLNEDISLEDKNEIKWTSMDEMFEKYFHVFYTPKSNNISDEDFYECEQYPLPDWWDDDSIEFIKE